MKDKSRSYYEGARRIVENIYHNAVNNISPDLDSNIQASYKTALLNLKKAFNYYLFRIQHDNDFPLCTRNGKGETECSDQRVLLFTEMAARISNGRLKFPSNYLSNAAPHVCVNRNQRGWPLPDDREDFLDWLSFLETVVSSLKSLNPALKERGEWLREMSVEERDTLSKKTTDSFILFSGRFDSLQGDLDQVKEENEELKSNNLSLTTTLIDEREKHNTEKNLLETSKAQLEQASQILLDKNRKLKAENKGLAENMRQLQSSKEKVEKENNILKSEKEALVTTNSTLRTEKERLQNENRTLKAAKTKLETTNTTLNTAKAQLETSNKTLEAEKVKLEQENAQLKTEVEGHVKTNNRLVGENNNLKLQQGSALQPVHVPQLKITEAGCTFQDWDVPQKLAPLINSISQIIFYGKKLSSENAVIGQEVNDFAMELLKKLKNDLKDGNTPDNFNTEFKDLLHSKDKEMNTHREWGSLIGNVAIALTIVGLVAIGIEYARTGHAFFPSERMLHIENIEKEFNTYRKTE